MNNQANPKQTKARLHKKATESAENISVMKQNQNIQNVQCNTFYIYHATTWLQISF